MSFQSWKDPKMKWNQPVHCTRQSRSPSESEMTWLRQQDWQCQIWMLDLRTPYLDSVLSQDSLRQSPLASRLSIDIDLLNHSSIMMNWEKQYEFWNQGDGFNSQLCLFHLYDPSHIIYLLKDFHLQHVRRMLPVFHGCCVASRKWLLFVHFLFFRVFF